MGGGRQPEPILGSCANCHINLAYTWTQLETVTYATKSHLYVSGFVSTQVFPEIQRPRYCTVQISAFLHFLSDQDTLNMFILSFSLICSPALHSS